MEEIKNNEILENEAIEDHEITITEIEVEVEDGAELSDEALEAVSGGAGKKKKKQKIIHVDERGADMHAEADEKSRFVYLLKPGSELWYLGRDKVDKNNRKWAYVQYGSKIGWIRKCYIL